MATIRRPGIWRRAGMNGALVGLDLNEAMGSLPAALDRDLARRLFVIAEAAYLPAAFARVKDHQD